MKGVQVGIFMCLWSYNFQPLKTSLHGMSDNNTKFSFLGTCVVKKVVKKLAEGSFPCASCIQGIQKVHSIAIYVTSF